MASRPSTLPNSLSRAQTQAKSEKLTFQGLRDYPPVDETDDWGLSVTEQETSVEKFRQLCESQGLFDKDKHDYYTLLRFLRARGYDSEKALKMWSDHLEWRRANNVDTILDDFVFEEKEQFLQYYPQGYHKVDKLGRPMYIQMLGKININKIKNVTTEDRMLQFHIQEYERCLKQILPVCSKLAGRNISQTFGVMDVKGVGLGHLTGEVKKLLSLITKTDSDNYPETLGHICIINAPGIFRTIWGFVKGMVDVRTQNKIEICSADYKRDLLKWVAEENLPDWLGGTSRGTLIDDVGPWSDPTILSNLGPFANGMRLPLPAAVLENGDDTAHATPRSDSSFMSVIQTELSGSGPSIPQTSDEAPQAHTPPPMSSPPTLAAARAMSISDTAPGGTSSIRGVRSRSLHERVRRLEAQLRIQAQRLDVTVELHSHAGSTAVEGSLLARVEALEDAMLALVEAQELGWKQQDQNAKAASSACCAKCSVM